MDASAERCLIVNADDFGLTSEINRGIVEAHELGVVTSASLMVRRPGSEEAADYARRREELSVGLHVELDEWRFSGGEWRLASQLVDMGDEEAVRRECRAQLARFRALLGRRPTHIDSHQHQHMREPVRSILAQEAKALGVPLRGCEEAIRYCGDFYGQTDEGAPYADGITLDAFVKLVDALPPGWTELGCHPGYATGLDSVYRAERETELRTLCQPALQEKIKRSHVRLRSFADYLAADR